MPTLTLFVALLFCSPLLWSASPATGPSVPPAIHAMLDQEYPGWKLAAVSPQIQQAFKKHKVSASPSLAGGDFDRDGKRDYAVQIALTKAGEEEQIVIIFLARPAGAFEENIVQSMGLDPTVYLWASNKAVSETGADAGEKLTQKFVLTVLGGPIGDTTYAYEDGRFQEIKVSDDPERPDPSIPRITISN